MVRLPHRRKRGEVTFRPRVVPFALRVAMRAASRSGAIGGSCSGSTTSTVSATIRAWRACAYCAPTAIPRQLRTVDGTEAWDTALLAWQWCTDTSRMLEEIRCRRRESNPHGGYPHDFESQARTPTASSGVSRALSLAAAPAVPATAVPAPRQQHFRGAGTGGRRPRRRVLVRSAASCQAARPVPSSRPCGTATIVPAVHWCRAAPCGRVHSPEARC